MSFDVTTLNGAVAAGDEQVRLTSGTGAVVGKILRVDDEKMKVLDISLSPVLRVARGIAGTAAKAHNTKAQAVLGLSSDFAAQPKEGVYGYGAAGALTVASGTHVLNSGAASAMTLAAPTQAQEGTKMRIVANTAHAYTVTYTAGFAAGTTSNDVATFGGAIGDSMTIEAVNGGWRVLALNNVTIS